MIFLDWGYWATLRQHPHARVVTILCTMMMCMNENTRILTAEWLQLSCKPGSCGKHAGAGQRRKLQEQLLRRRSSRLPSPRSPRKLPAPVQSLM